MHELILAIICFAGFICGISMSKVLKEEVKYGKKNYRTLKFYMKYNLTKIYPFAGLLFLLNLPELIVSFVLLYSIFAGSMIKYNSKNELFYYLLFFAGPVLRII